MRGDARARVDLRGPCWFLETQISLLSILPGYPTQQPCGTLHLYSSVGDEALSRSTPYSRCHLVTSVCRSLSGSEVSYTTLDNDPTASSTEAAWIYSALVVHYTQALSLSIAICSYSGHHCIRELPVHRQLLRRKRLPVGTVEKPVGSLRVGLCGVLVRWLRLADGERRRGRCGVL
ncbi:uncharacterized protein B0H18DRAFT_99890 [Fomitopsis serialis]|uniref:uncharacterized protein n=1 Tax=Fomitopsis serialis TaxID=139415 RepID=UPI00200825A8|nr:uncharacterized protein B0H18DRAFT_99890 [Neoantrodia serialis]KAH9915344.1 hypothetical protein B0H18DRAFT_99890 [Neoantrodia serialis]